MYVNWRICVFATSVSLELSIAIRAWALQHSSTSATLTLDSVAKNVRCEYRRYPNVGEDHQEAEWDLFTENDLVDHWPAILLQARHGMIVRERLGRIVPEHEWPQTLVE